ncbi:MAG: hypothetical protein EZS28_040768, partial [Streblomastix strix]
TSIITQSVGAGMQSATACIWDVGSDSYVVETWTNNAIQVYVTVYGFAM